LRAKTESYPGSVFALLRAIDARLIKVIQDTALPVRHTAGPEAPQMHRGRMIEAIRPIFLYAEA
jgi:hypothetical protein